MRKENIAITVLISLLLLTVGSNAKLFETKSVSANIIAQEKSPQKLPALLRFEDVGPGKFYTNQENLDKLNVVADYLQQEGVPFAVSLIPRVVEPDNNYDVTIADNTEPTQRFVSAMKSLEEKGGIIGVHGYTHQSGDNNSVTGYEFYNPTKNSNVPNTYEYAKDRVDKAIELFNKAGIKPAYWETPHYSASSLQHIAFQKQIGLIYENNYDYYQAWKNINIINKYKQHFYGVDVVPTPLGHLVNSNESIASTMDSLDNFKTAGKLASLYYHPTGEFPYIHKAYHDNGDVYYTYDEESPLHQLVKGFKDRGYSFISIYSLMGFVPAQRYENIPFGIEDEILTGQFQPDTDRKSVLIRNKKANQWHMYKYTPSWYAPRDINAFEDLGIWLKDLSLAKETIPIVGRFKNKNKDDILLFNAVTGNLILAENNGNKFIPHNQKWQVLSNAVLPLAGELNGDGLTDLFLYDKKNARIGTAINKDGLFNDITWQSFNLLKTKHHKLLAGDYNGDSISDILVIDQDTNKWWMLVGEKSGTFSLAPEPWNSEVGFGKYHRTFAADVNGDNKDDFIYYSPNGFWQCFISDGTKFVPGVSFGPWGAGSNKVSEVADIDGDKRADLVMVDHNYTGGTYDLNTAISVLNR